VLKKNGTKNRASHGFSAGGDESVFSICRGNSTEIADAWRHKESSITTPIPPASPPISNPLRWIKHLSEFLYDSAESVIAGQVSMQPMRLNAELAPNAAHTGLAKQPCTFD
jgi:hypothetical protein